MKISNKKMLNLHQANVGLHKKNKKRHITCGHLFPTLCFPINKSHLDLRDSF